MNGAWSDGAPRPAGGTTANAAEPRHLPDQHPRAVTSAPTGERGDRDKSFAARTTSRVNRILQNEGRRGRASRATLALRYVNYFFLISLFCALTGILTRGVRYASGGGTFMLVSCTVIVVVGAVGTLFYVNLRKEIVERVRHYIFGIILIPGTLLAGTLRALQEWEWVNEGSLGKTLQAALPAIFLASVVLPAIIFVKELVQLRTLHRTKLDDEESVQLWTRQDGLQR